MKRYLPLLLIIFTLEILPPSSAHGQNDSAVCAAVLPCDLFGGVLPQFSDRSSPCFPRYETQCAAHASRISLLDEYAADLARQVARLRESNRNLRRANRRLNQTAATRGRV